MIYLLGTLLIILLIICYFLEEKDVISPAFIFIFGFSFQSLWAIFYSKAWELKLHLNTFFVILFGSLIFFCASQALKKYMRQKSKKNKKEYKINLIKIDIWKQLLTIIFVLAVSIIYLVYVFKGANMQFEGISSIPKAIAQYDQLLKFSNIFNTVKAPSIVENLRLVSTAIGYWFIYVLINNYLINKKVDILALIIIIISALNTTLTGSRGSIIMMIISSGVFFIILKNRQSRNKFELNYKTMALIAIIGIIMLTSFVPLAKALGRNINIKTTDYLAIYIGAEVKNLDIFLQKKDKIIKNNILGSQTFYSAIQTIGSKTKLIRNYKPYKLDLPFNKINGYNLGNVYTTFYPFIYDFGYLGLILLTLIMAIISQYIYEKVRLFKNNNQPSLYVLVYGTIFSCLLFSFFSNKFYENVISMYFVKTLIVWYICNYFYCKLEIKKRGKNIDEENS